MRIGGLALMACVLVGCATGYEADVQRMQEAFATAWEHSRSGDTRAERQRLWSESRYYRKGLAIHDSLYQLGPSIRYHSESLARADSGRWAQILVGHVSRLYFEHDTLAAVFAYMDAWSWVNSWSQSGQAAEQRRFAETMGDAISLTHSPNMARLTYQAFERAKWLALDHGDPMYIYLADSSYKAIARQVFHMPDSVRLAFGPAPAAPAHVPWGLTLLAAVFMLAHIAGVGRRNRDS